MTKFFLSLFMISSCFAVFKLLIKRRMPWRSVRCTAKWCFHWGGVLLFIWIMDHIKLSLVPSQPMMHYKGWDMDQKWQMDWFDWGLNLIFGRQWKIETWECEVIISFSDSLWKMKCVHPCIELVGNIAACCLLVHEKVRQMSYQYVKLTAGLKTNASWVQNSTKKFTTCKLLTHTPTCAWLYETKLNFRHLSS